MRAQRVLHGTRQVSASRLPTANASLLVLQLYTAVAHEIAAAAGGFYFTFCGAENFTTAERLFHVLHMQNISLIYSESLLRFLFCLFGTHEWDSKDERHRATVRWTVVTASDQAPAGARIESHHRHQKKALLRKCFFQRNPPFGWVKYCYAM